MSKEGIQDRDKKKKIFLLLMNQVITKENITGSDQPVSKNS